MTLEFVRINRHSFSIFVVFAALVIWSCAGPASAQGWRAVDAQNAFSGYNNAFLYLEPDGYSKVFVTTQDGSTHEGF
jgi:hypothetical protein